MIVSHLSVKGGRKNIYLIEEMQFVRIEIWLCMDVGVMRGDKKGKRDVTKNLREL